MIIKKIYYGIYNKLNLRLRQVKKGKNVKINGKLHIKGRKSNIVIGDNCVINSGIKFNPLVHSPVCSLGTSLNGHIVIGNNVGISNSSVFSDDEIIIEDYVKIGNSSTVFDTDFHPIDPIKRRNLSDEIKSKPIRIKRNAWIGCNCLIMKGVTIGENSIIAAGALVTKSVPDNEIWGGNPAKFIRKVTAEDQMEELGRV